MSAGLDLRLSCCRGELTKVAVVGIVAGARLKHRKMKTDSRRGSWKISGGNVAESLHGGLGGVPKSSLETWNRLSSRPDNLHWIPGHDEPGSQGFG